MNKVSDAEDGIVILSGDEIPSSNETGTEYGGQFQSELRGFDKLQRAWPIVVQRLKTIMESEDLSTDSGGLGIQSVEFGITISAGFDFVIKGNADADARITFARK